MNEVEKLAIMLLKRHPHLKVGNCLNCGEDNWSLDKDSFCLTCWDESEEETKVDKFINDILWKVLTKKRLMVVVDK